MSSREYVNEIPHFHQAWASCTVRGALLTFRPYCCHIIFCTALQA